MHVSTVISRSEDESLRLGTELGRRARPGTVYALYGDLGSGKTVLARGIARGLGITDDITSPTFTLLEIYEGVPEGAPPLYHFDLYRIERVSEFVELGFEEYWEGDGVSVIEWAERAAGLLPESTIRIYLEYHNEHGRKIRVEYPGD